MSVSPNTQAVMLLTAHFSKSNGDSVKPLTPKEWGRFAAWLKENSLTPEQFMVSSTKELLKHWSDRHISVDRLEALLNRGSALAIALEKWLRAGLWVMTRADCDYPYRLKRRLGTDSPAVLYGCGNRSLLNTGGLAVVGSRNAVDSDLEYTRLVGVAAASEGYSIVSGAARGVDEASILGALEKEGTAVGVLADSLLRACSSRKYRSHLMAKNLVLVSTFHPEAGFNAGNAMQRNKYIYCLSDAALVVHSGMKGGTWSGAMENLKKGWVPLWVKMSSDSGAGNAALVNQGGYWVSKEARELIIGKLFDDRNAPRVEQEDLLSKEEKRSSVTEASSMEQQPELSLLPSESTGEASTEIEVIPSTSVEGIVDSTPVVTSTDEPLTSYEGPSFYDLFLQKISQTCAESGKTPGELAELFDLNKTQVGVWLKRAVAEKKVRKLTKPVRYEWVDDQQKSLF